MAFHQQGGWPEHPRAMGGVSNNPFDDLDDGDFVSSASAFRSGTHQDSYNPFTALEQSMTINHAMPIPSNSVGDRVTREGGLNSIRPSNSSTPSSFVGGAQQQYPSSATQARGVSDQPRPPLATKQRSESKESVLSEGTINSSDNSDASEEEEEEEEEGESEEDDGNEVYGLDRLSDNLGGGGGGRNRALLFMESDAPSRVECTMRISEDGTRYELFAARDKNRRLWLRAQRRKEGGLKRKLGGLSVSFWVSPLLLLGENKGEELSFGEMMRELEVLEEMETHAVSQKSLRAGKLDGNSRHTKFQLFGGGKSLRTASGVLDARPEFMGARWASATSCTLALPARGGPKPRPLRRRDFLLRRTGTKSTIPPGLRRATCTRTTSSTGLISWVFTEDSSSSSSTTFLVRITRKTAEEYTVEFKDISPLVAFALAVLASIKSTSGSFLSRTASSLGMLPRINSMRKDSFSRAATMEQHSGIGS